MTWHQEGIWVEAGWQTLASQECALATLGGAATDHDLLVVASAVLHAVALRTGGRLAAWQQALAVYPEALGDALIARAVQRWH